MTMDRRNALKCIGGASALTTLAGCIGVQQQGSGGGDQSGNNQSSGNENTNGTAGSSGPAGTADVWYSLPEPEIAARKRAIKQFNSQSKHTISGADISDMRKKTTSAIPAGQGAKTFEWGHDWVGDYFQRGFIVDQSDELNVNLDRFTNTATDAIQYKDNVVGLPHTAETIALIYNTDIVDKPPETVDELVSMMKEHHNPSNNTYGLTYLFDPYNNSPWLRAFGGYYFNQDKDPALGVDNKKTIRGLEFVLDNFRPYMPNDPKYEPQSAAFAAGNAAFSINGPWYLATLNEKDVNYKVTTLPTLNGSEVSPYTTISMWYFAKSMEDNGANTEAARKFIEWFATNEDHILKLAKEQGSIPVLSSLAGSDELPDVVKTFSQVVKQGTAMPTHPKMNDIWPPMRTALFNAFNGNASAKTAMNTAAETIRSNWE